VAVVVLLGIVHLETLDPTVVLVVVQVATGVELRLMEDLQPELA
tara:strand:- start:185 stop:316 length:132 start_codon:yes stop_codon:yes gene_type:complete